MYVLFLVFSLLFFSFCYDMSLINLRHNLAALTIRWMMKPWITDNDSVRLIVCTGERVQGLVEKLYRQAGIRTTTFDVQHMNGLSNQFLCYSSFEGKNLKWEHIDTLKREGDY